MELVSEDLHLVLTYIAATERAGASLSIDRLEAYAGSPRPIPPVTRNRWDVSFTALLSGLQLKPEVVRPGESTGDFLLRVSWITAEDDRVKLTPLGRAVLSHADRPALADPADEPLSVTIDPNDRLAYAKIFSLIASQGAGLLVDPYLTLEGFEDVIAISSIDRVLTSNRESRNKRLNILAHAAGAVEDPPEIRTTPPAQLHDRFFIPDDGPIYVLNSSLNSIAKRPGVVTPIADESAASAVRRAYADLWADATVLTPEPPAR